MNSTNEDDMVSQAVLSVQQEIELNRNLNQRRRQQRREENRADTLRAKDEKTQKALQAMLDLIQIALNSLLQTPEFQSLLATDWPKRDTGTETDVPFISLRQCPFELEFGPETENNRVNVGNLIVGIKNPNQPTVALFVEFVMHGVQLQERAATKLPSIPLAWQDFAALLEKRFLVERVAKQLLAIKTS